MAGLKTLYFVPYNAVLCLGWLYVLVRAVVVVVATEQGYGRVYPAVSFELQLVQTAAVLEIVHSLLGIVRSPVMATLPQVGSRLFLVWGILYLVPQVQSHPLVFSLLLSWCITEVFRYAFFAVKEATGSAPRILLWLRYTLFYVLYPTGIASELGLIYLALPHIKESGILRVDMPNRLNVAFDYYVFCLLTISAYVPVGPHMYIHMMGQRRKAFSTAKDKTA